MAKERSNDLLPTLGGIFCLFVVFLRAMALLSSFSVQGLLIPSLWLLLGLCLMTRKKNWLTLVGMLPLTIITVQGAIAPIPLDSVAAFSQALVCRVFPAMGFLAIFLLLLLGCFHGAYKVRRELWFLPVVLTLPNCIWQYAATLPWAEFGMIACVTFWLKPRGK